MSNAQLTAVTPGDVFRAREDCRFVTDEYVPYLRHCARVLDLACGWGALLQALRRHGVQGFGVDADPAAVEFCRASGIEAVESDVLEYLSTSSEIWDGIALSHIIEHFPREPGIRLLRLAWEHLEPGGTMVIVTPNMDNPGVRSHGFRLDPTHVEPFPRALIEQELRRLGARIVRSGNSKVERRRFRERLRRNPARGIASLGYHWLRYGPGLAFLQGDTYVVAAK